MLVGSEPASLGRVILAQWLRHKYGPASGCSRCLGLHSWSVIGKVVMEPGRRCRLLSWLTRRDHATAISLGVMGGFVSKSLLIAFPLRSADVAGRIYSTRQPFFGLQERLTQ
jgi:hypothetical protein